MHRKIGTRTGVEMGEGRGGAATCLVAVWHSTALPQGSWRGWQERSMLLKRVYLARGALLVAVRMR